MGVYFFYNIYIKTLDMANCYSITNESNFEILVEYTNTTITSEIIKIEIVENSYINICSESEPIILTENAIYNITTKGECVDNLCVESTICLTCNEDALIGLYYGKIYSHNPITNQTNFLFQVPAVIPYSNNPGHIIDDIAHTKKKLWILFLHSNFNNNNGSLIIEYDITLCPFTYTFNRYYNINSKLDWGLYAIDDDKLISSTDNPKDIIEIKLRPTFTISTKIQSINTDVSDLILLPNQNLIYTDRSGNPISLYVYNYLNGNFIGQFSIGLIDTSLFYIDNKLYLISLGGQIYEIDYNNNYTINLINNLNFNELVYGASSIYTCVTTTICLTNCNVLFNDGANIYAYSVGSYTLYDLGISPIQASADDIAHTNNHIWLVKRDRFGNTTFYCLDITLCPFTMTYNNRYIYYRLTLFGKGLFAYVNSQSDDILITSLGNYIVEVNTVTYAITNKFPMMPGRTIAGDILLTPNNELVCVYIDSLGNRFITFTNYNNGNIIFDIPCPQNKIIESIFVDSNYLYAVTITGEIMLVDLLGNFNFIAYQQLTIPPYLTGSSSLLGCNSLDTCFCFEYEIYVDQNDLNAAIGNDDSLLNHAVVFNYIDCNNLTPIYYYFTQAGNHKICIVVNTEIFGPYISQYNNFLTNFASTITPVGCCPTPLLTTTTTISCQCKNYTWINNGTSTRKSIVYVGCDDVQYSQKFEQSSGQISCIKNIVSTVGITVSENDCCCKCYRLTHNNPFFTDQITFKNCVNGATSTIRLSANQVINICSSVPPTHSSVTNMTVLGNCQINLQNTGYVC